MQLTISVQVMHSSGIFSLDERSLRYPKWRLQCAAVGTGFSVVTAGWVSAISGVSGVSVLVCVMDLFS